MNKKRLGNYGYRITAKVDSEETLQAFQAAPDSFDLLITDLTMPKLTGLQLIEKIRAIRPNMSIIICTGYSSTEKLQAIKDIGVTNILLKPISGQDLLETTRRVLDEQGRKM